MIVRVRRRRWPERWHFATMQSISLVLTMFDALALDGVRVWPSGGSRIDEMPDRLNHCFQAEGANKFLA